MYQKLMEVKSKSGINVKIKKAPGFNYFYKEQEIRNITIHKKKKKSHLHWKALCPLWLMVAVIMC